MTFSKSLKPTGDRRFDVVCLCILKTLLNQALSNDSKRLFSFWRKPSRQTLELTSDCYIFSNALNGEITIGDCIHLRFGKCSYEWELTPELELTPLQVAEQKEWDNERVSKCRYRGQCKHFLENLEQEKA